MPRSDTDRDRRRLRAAILIAAALHGLVFALFAFLPAAGITWVAGCSTPGLGGSGVSAAVLDSEGAGGLSRHARSAGMRVIPVLVEPLEQGASSPRDSSPSHPANAIRDASMDIAVDGARQTNEPNDATRDANSPGVDTSGPSALGEGAGFGADADAMASGGASGAGGSGGITGVSGADGVVAFGQTQRIFAQWLDSAIRARLSYPERARARNAEGTVVVALTVPADGAHCDALVAKSSGNSILDRAAIELIRSLFPAKVAPGTPFSAPVTISFTLTPASNP